MRRIFPGGITGRLIIYLALIGVLPPLVVGMISYGVSQSTLRNEALRHTEQLLQAQSDYLEAQLEQVQELIGNVLGVEAITEVVGERDSEPDVYSQLATQARIGYLLNAYIAVRGLVSIDIFTVDGRHYHVGDTLDVQSIDEAQRDALFAAASKKPDETLWVGAETNVNGKSRVPRVIATARAIEAFEPDGGSRVAGLLLVSQDANYFHAAFRRLEGEMLGGLLLIDGRNRIIYHRDAALIGTKLPSSILAGLAGVQGSAQRAIDGVDMLVSEVTSPTTGWRLVSLLPLQELDARSSPIWRTTTMAILACLLVIALTTLSFSRAVVMPLRRIRQGFQELQRGGAASVQPLPIHGRDEVAELMAWFNAFLESSGARERSEQALREAETRFRMMHEASFTGLCVHHEGVVLEANQALCREFGRDYADLIGTRLCGLLAPDTPAATLTSLECRETHGLDVEAVRADGSRFPAELSSRAMPFRGLNAYVVDIRNIESRKRTEAELERLKNQAEVASRAKSQFLATMSHEIRTPMNAVLGLAFLLQNRGLSAVEHEMVRKIRNAGQLLLGIINNILDFSKIEAGRLEIACEPFRLGDVLDNVASIMAAAAGAKDIELVIGSVPAEAMFLRGDALRLEQVLVNLVGNAIKFTETGYVALTVTTSRTRPGAVDLRFGVRDTGIGITPEQQEDIFSAFSQAEGSTTRRFGGTGLGLTITRRIVTLMGGSVAVASTLGAGSEFSIDAPFLLDPEEASLRAAPTDAGAAPPDKLRVLITEDHPVALAMLVDVARSLGWNVVGSASGDQAVERAVAAADAGAPFDALLLDWKMPGTDGLTAAGNLRAALGDRQSPAIILVTACDKADLPRSALAGVVDEVLSKPVTASAMRDAVDRTRRRLAGRREMGDDPHQDMRLANRSILVVDDSEINREVAKQILEGEGARVFLASDGGQALSILGSSARDVHIVLMDIQMPVMDGYEATRQIREVLQLTELPVVALTADVLEGQQAATLKAGMNEFVAKPFDVDQLVSTIVRLTDRDGPPPQPDAKANPAIDLTRGLRNWKDGVAFKRYLRRFAESHGNDAAAILHMLDLGMRAEASAALHKLKGAAGSMALTTVSRSADEAQRALAQERDMADAMSLLRGSLEAASVAIAAYAGVEDDDAQRVPAGDPATTIVLLETFLGTLAHDDLDEAEVALDGMAGSLPTDRVAALREHLGNFDFRAAEAVARAVAGSMSPQERVPVPQ